MCINDILPTRETREGGGEMVGIDDLAEEGAGAKD
jgi:hypothetical protein